jgi:type I restriction enzyme S subunit
MSKLDELIAELCPDGVPYKTLGELGYFYGGLSGKSKEDFANGNAKFITYMNVFTNLAIDTDISDLVRIGENEKQNTVQYGDILFTGSSETPDECGMSSVLTEVSDEKFYLNSFCFGFRLKDNNLLLPDFSKYLFRSQNIRKQIKRTANGVTRFNVSKKKMEQVVIPLPPLPVQQEIVRILDNFTELTAELTARRKQYEYYRKILIKNSNNIRQYSLGELATLKTGSKPKDVFEFPHKYEYINAGTTNSGYTDKANCDGDTVTTPSRGQGGIGFVGYQYDPFWLGPLCYRIKSRNDKIVTNRYLFYYLSCFNEKILAYKKEGGTPSVNASDLVNIIVDVPPLTEQKRIVAILDRFDALCNDLTSGIPAEIEARQKQYEYYRDKLLSFKEVTA